MKKTLILSIATLVAMGSIILGCSKEDNLQQKKSVVTKTATISLHGKSNTKALTPGGVKTFAAGERMAVVYKNMGGTTVKAVSEALKDDGDITNEGKSAKFSVALEDPDYTKDVTYIYPAAMANADGTVNYDALATQDGTLSSLASNLDYCTLTAAWEGTSLPNGTLENQFAICAFTLKNSDGSSEITNTITGMTISDGIYTYTVSRSATAGPIYVVMRPTTSANIWITATATASSKNYCKSLTSKTYAAGNGYPLALRMMTYHNLALASFNEDADAYIYQDPTTATSNTITISDGRKVTLAGVNMLVSGNAINCVGNAEIVLSGTNTIYGQYSSSGDNNKAIIKAGTYDPMTTLIISGSGSLEVRTKYTGSWMGAFIGSDKNGDCGNITITGGTITAIAYPNPGASEYNNSAAYGAIIGSGSANGSTSRCGDILISGGTVTVDTHKGNGTGIGSGMSENSSGYSTCGTITISGGNVTATTWGGGAAIGSGASSIYLQNPTYNGYSKCEGIVITGTNTVVNAYSKPNSGSNDYAGAAIGTGNAGEVTGGITISGGTVTASTTYSAPGIGAGKYRSNCGNILISGGTVEATGGSNAAGIGTAKGLYKCVSTCGTITITNGVTKVKVTKGTSGTKTIGKGYSSNSTCGTVTIGGTVYSNGVSDSPYTYEP